MRFGLLGGQLTHSFSPMIHSMLGKYEYNLYEKKPDELDLFFQAGKFDGLNVTIPYKKDVIKYCKSLSETAQSIGSVNTIIRLEDGTLYGDNTDFFGFSYLLDKVNIDITSGKTIILGSGGSSLTVQEVLKSKNAKEIVVISRKGKDNYKNINKHKDAILIVNTTPVGMYPNNGDSPVKDLKIFKNCQAVIDLIYNPSITGLMFQAEKLEIPTVNGLDMLVAQAKRSSEHFLGSKLPDTAIEEIAAKIDRKTKNIILIGMPGCGKTTTGAALAEKMNRKFIDTDDIIKKTTGKQVPVIIKKDGEKAFRRLETEALNEVCKQSNLVIATGGGAVTRPENLNIMRQNGRIVYLKRDIKELATKDRPLSESKGIEKLAAERLPLYEKWCDYKVNVGTFNNTVDEIMNRR